MGIRVSEEVQRRIDAALEKYGDRADDVALAARVVRELPLEDVKDLARAAVAVVLQAMERKTVLKVERGAVHQIRTKDRGVRPATSRDDVGQIYWEDLRADPTLLKQANHQFGYQRDRYAFYRSFPSKDEAYVWYYAAVEEFPPDDAYRTMWYPDGPQAYCEGQNFSKMVSSIQGAIAELSQGIRLEVTEELLSSRFALGDGVRVTWGEATVEQHRQRYELLEKNVIANAEAGARHLTAIRMIEEAHVSTLAEVPQEEAA